MRPRCLLLPMPEGRFLLGEMLNRAIRSADVFLTLLVDVIDAGPV